MGIIKTRDTNYYELDWYVPTEDTNKVYLAINGEVEENSVLSIMANGVGYDWKVEDKQKITPITKQQFLEKAKTNNVVHFFKDEKNYNDLLNYPKDIQRVIDLVLFNDGFKPHHKLSIKEQLQILKTRKKNKLTVEVIDNSVKKHEKGRVL